MVPILDFGSIVVILSTPSRDGQKIVTEKNRARHDCQKAQDGVFRRNHNKHAVATHQLAVRHLPSSQFSELAASARSFPNSGNVEILAARLRLSRVWFRAEVQNKRIKPLPAHPRIFPTIGVAADVPKTDRGVGHDLVATLPDPLAEGIVFGKIPMPVLARDEASDGKRGSSESKTLVAHWQLKAFLNRQIHFPPDQQEPGPGIEDFHQPTVLAEDDLRRARHDVAGQGPSCLSAGRFRDTIGKPCERRRSIASGWKSMSASIHIVSS